MTETNVPRLRILIADDNELVRTGLCTVLQEHDGWEICGEAVDGAQAIQMTLELKPDVLLLDISMPDLNGFEVAKRIHDSSSATGILIVSAYDASAFDHIEAQNSVCGYVMKSRISSDLVPAIEAATSRRHASAAAAA